MSDMGILRRIEQATSAYRAGNRNHWVTCCVAYRVVGLFQEGTTKTLGQSLSVSSDTIERMAMAYRMWEQTLEYSKVYRDTYKGHELSTLRQVRDRLTVKHYVTMYRLLRRFEFDPWDAVLYLRDAAEHGISANALEDMVASQQGGWSEQEAWQAHLYRGSKTLRAAISDYGIPDELRKATIAYLQVVDRVLGHVG